jgi:hypothetical protein
MKKPIELDINHCGSIITAILKEQGKTEYTLSFDEFIKQDLGSFAIRCMSEWSDGKDYPDSITVSVVSVSDLNDFELRSMQ